jgi:hypothetical protein
VSQTKPAPHPFLEDPDLPPDHLGRLVCRCGLVGRPGDAHHDMPDVPEQAAHRHRYGDDDPPDG